MPLIFRGSINNVTPGDPRPTDELEGDDLKKKKARIAFYAEVETVGKRKGVSGKEKKAIRIPPSAALTLADRTAYHGGRVAPIIEPKLRQTDSKKTLRSVINAALFATRRKQKIAQSALAEAGRPAVPVYHSTTAPEVVG